MTTTTAVRNLQETVWRVGVPADQLANFLRAGYLPQPKQMELHAAARRADETDGPSWIGFGGARGPGKSHATFAQLTLDDCQRADGLKALFLRKIGKSARESFEDLRARVLSRTPHTYRRQEGVVEFVNGSRVILGHYNNEGDIDNYLGIEYDAIVLEEATALTHEKYKRLLGSLRTSRQDWRPRLYATTNPGGVGHAWFKREFVQGRGPVVFIHATIDDNAFVNQEYRAYLDGLTGWLRRAWRYGDWDIQAGQFFTTWRHEVHVVEPHDIPLGWRVWLAMDYGFVHPTAIYLLAEDGDGTVHLVDEHVQSRWLPPRHARAVDAMLERWDVKPGRVYQFVAGADVFAQRGSEQTIAQQYALAGYKLTPANDDRINGAAEWLKRMGDVDAGIAPSVRVFSTCARLIETMPQLQHDPHRPEDVLKTDVDDDGQGGDDCYDGSRYGLMVAKRAAAGRRTRRRA